MVGGLKHHNVGVRNVATAIERQWRGIGQGCTAFKPTIKSVPDRYVKYGRGFSLGMDNL